MVNFLHVKSNENIFVESPTVDKQVGDFLCLCIFFRNSINVNPKIKTNKFYEFATKNLTGGEK